VKGASQEVHVVKLQEVEELTMIQELFNKLDVARTGRVDKADVINMLGDDLHRNFLQRYRLSRGQLSEQVKSFVTRNPQFFSLTEFVRFLRRNRPRRNSQTCDTVKGAPEDDWRICDESCLLSKE